MKKYIFALGFTAIVIACGQPESRDKAADGAWLYTDGRSQLCLQELRARGLVPAGMPVVFYPDSANIVQIRQSNPGVYSVAETEYKGLCRSVGIDLDVPGVDPGGRRGSDR
ncbi:MAG: hypothetical protein ABL958_20660 [Bdellovibrionia bacterium]